MRCMLLFVYFGWTQEEVPYLAVARCGEVGNTGRRANPNEASECRMTSERRFSGDGSILIVGDLLAGLVTNCYKSSLKVKFSS